MPAVSFNGEVIEYTNSLRHFGIQFDRMLTYKTQVEATKLGCQEMTVRAESHGFKRYRTTLSVSAVSECNTQRHLLWSGS